MADWTIYRDLFGDEAGPVQVLLVLSAEVSEDEMKAINQHMPFRHISFQDYDLDDADFCEMFDIILSDVCEIPVPAQFMFLVEFYNERDIRDCGAKTALQLLTSGKLIGAYKMSAADASEVIELNRKLEEINILFATSLEFVADVEEFMFRSANSPKKFIRNYDAIIEEFGFFDYGLVDQAVHFDVDRSKIVGYAGRCEALLQSLYEVPALERDDCMGKIREFIEGLELD
jgi:hypothetical protein